MTSTLRTARFAASLAALALATLVLTPATRAGSNSSPAPDIKLIIMPPKAPVPAGDHAEVTLLISTPPGIGINKYPPVKLTLEPQPGIMLDKNEIRMGSETPIDDPEDFHFETVDPMRIGFKVEAGAAAGTARIQAR